MRAAVAGSTEDKVPWEKRRTIGVLTSLFPSPARPREGVFALRRYQGLVARGHTVILVQPTPRAPWPLGLISPRRYGDLAKRPREEWLDSIWVHRPRYTHLPSAPLGNARRFVRKGVAELANQERRGQYVNGSPLFDVVIADYAWPAAMAAPTILKIGKPFLISGRGSDVLQVAGEAGLGEHLAGALRQASGYFAVSQDLVDAMDRLSGEARGVLVPNGVDQETFRPPSADERVALRKRLGLGDAKCVLVVGHLIPRKDPLLALAAFEALSTTHPGTRCLFVGAGELEGALRERIAAKNLNAELLGERDPAALAELYRAADALLLTSSREGRPNVVLEAFASGLPVVATAAGGTAELFAASPFDVVHERDAQTLSARLREVLDTPPPTEDIVAAVRPLSWTASLERLEGLMDACLQP